MKKWIILAAVVLCFSMSVSLVGCNNKISLSFDYEVGEQRYVRGAEVKVIVNMENLGKSFSYTESQRSAFLFIQTGDESYCIYEIVGIAPDMMGENRYTIGDGMNTQKTYRFLIPDDAPLGKYSLSVSCLDVNTTFSDVIEIISK